MAVWSAVSVSALEYSRFDADFYHPKYLNELEFWRRLDTRIGVAKLGRIIAAPVRTGRTPRSRSIKGDEETIRFIKTDTVREGSVDFNNSALLPLRVVSDRDIIPAGAVVMTIIGATPEIVGRTAIVRSNDPACVTNQNVAVISTNGNFDPFFLTAYFQTTWGRDQVWRHSRRTEQVNLNCREVERVLVPKPPLAIQADIGNLVRNSFAATDQSVELYERAQQIFEEELSPRTVTVAKPMGYLSQFSETVADGRFDADYYQPQYAAMRALVQNYQGGAESLLAYCDSLRPNVDPSANSIDMFDYIELSNIDATIGLVDGALSGNGSTLPSRARRQVRAGDVIASAVVGSVDKAAIISDEQDGFIASTGFFHLRPRTVTPEYLLMLVRSQCVRMQFQQQATGGILSAVPDSRLKRVIVPKIPESIRQEITGLVAESHAAKRKSDGLLEEAKIRVEQLIGEAIQP